MLAAARKLNDQVSLPARHLGAAPIFASRPLIDEERGSMYTPALIRSAASVDVGDPHVFFSAADRRE